MEITLTLNLWPIWISLLINLCIYMEETWEQTPSYCKARMGIFACKNSAQCWEPCGQLGKDATHVY